MFHYIGIIAVIVLGTWLAYKFIQLVRDVGIKTTLLAPVWIIGVIFRKR
jgi:hypothetical protein